MDNEPRLWGQQYPFERNYLQRTMTLTGLAGVFAVTTILLLGVRMPQVLGVALMCLGLVFALAAGSRHRYVQETRLGFAILDGRGGSFVLGSAVAFAVVGLSVALLVLRS